MTYSCNIKLYNDSQYKLIRKDYGGGEGTWQPRPPLEIFAFSFVSFNLVPVDAPYTYGYVVYETDVDGEIFHFDFRDPVSSENECSVTNPNRNKFSVYFMADTGGAQQNNKCPTSGSPLSISYHISSFV